MGSIVTRKLAAGDCHYAVYYVEGTYGKREQKWHPCRYPNGKPMSKPDAKRELARLETQAAAGSLADSANLTFGDFLDRWLEHRKSNWEAQTLEKYAQVVRDIVQPNLGHIRLKKLKPAYIQDFIIDCKKKGACNGGPLSEKTVKDIHGIVRSALTHAVKLQLLDYNPASRVDPPKVVRREPRAATEEERAALIEQIQSSEFATPIWIALATGLRLGEICALRWEDYDLKHQCLIVRNSHAQLAGRIVRKTTKNDRVRTILVTPSLARILQAHREEQQRSGKDHGGWICTHPDGRAFTPSSLGHGMSRIARKAGVDISLHGLRHTLATELLNAGVPSDTVRAIGGWATIGIMHDLYAHSMPHHQQSATGEIEHLLNPVRPKIKVVNGGNNGAGDDKPGGNP